MANVQLLPEPSFQQFDGGAPEPVSAEVSGLHLAHTIKVDKTPIPVSCAPVAPDASWATHAPHWLT